MYFVVFATDRPNCLALRASLKSSHSRHLDEGAENLKVLQSGPTVSANGDENGSLLIVSAPDEAAVRDFFSRDPYAEGRLFLSIDIRRWDWKRGNPERS